MTEPQATTTSGAVRGSLDEGVFAFLGLPYAAPPFGPRRFAAPEAPEPWDGVRDCIEHGPTAPQPEQGPTIIPEPTKPGDDCLNLTVYTPDLGGARLPVLVWIHGGSFVNGGNLSPWYRGTRFARDGVVFVGINYRLGVEGFLEVDGAPSNRGVLDWIAALEWVHDNIASFGGDPGRVTIAGQSAGSAACIHLLNQPRAAGLFGRAICQSGVADTRMTADTAKQLGRDVAAKLGVHATRDDLARFSPDELIAAHKAVAGEIGVDRRFDPTVPALKPFVDGEVVSEHPMRALRDGAAPDVDVLAGATANELNGVVRIGRFDADGARRALAGIGVDADAQQRYAARVGSDDPVVVLGQALTDHVFRVPVTRLLDARAGVPARTFAYDFRWPSPAGGGVVGACHCLDVPFAFDLLDADGVVTGVHGPNPPQSLADEMHGAWVRFATDGDPGWPAHDLKDRRTKLFDVPSSVAGDPLAFERGVFTRSREVPERPVPA